MERTENTNGTVENNQMFEENGGNSSNTNLDLARKILEDTPEEDLFWVDDFREGFARTLIKTPVGMRWLFINEHSKTVAFNGEKFIFANHFKNGIAEITAENGKSGIINKYGKIELFSKKKR